MTKLVFTLLAAATIAAPVLAGTTPSAIQFSRDGMTFVATDTVVNGVHRISGHELTTGRQFHLRTRGQFVWGDFDGQQVSYIMPKTGAVMTGAETASR